MNTSGSPAVKFPQGPNVIIRLTHPDSEACYHWLQRNTTGTPCDLERLTHRCPTTQLYWAYRNWLLTTTFQPVTIEEFWGIILLTYPWVTILGRPGDRAFAGIKRL